MAPPAAGARRGGLPGGRDRRPRLRPLVEAAPRSRPTGCSPTSPTTSPSCARWGRSTATIVGHDWGSPIAANSALLRPDLFTAAALLSVPFSPPGGPRPTEAYAQHRRRRGVLRQLLPGAGTGRGGDRARRARLADRLLRRARGRAASRGSSSPRAAGSRIASRPTARCPDWLDLDFYVDEFERTGLTGAPEPLPQRRPRLGGPRGLGRRAAARPVAVHRRSAGRHDDLDGRGRRRPTRTSTSSTAAGTGSSRNAPTRSTPSCSSGSRAPDRGARGRRARVPRAGGAAPA